MVVVIYDDGSLTLSGAFEEGLAALARVHAVVVAAGGVRAHLADLVLEVDVGRRRRRAIV